MSARPTPRRPRVQRPLRSPSGVSSVDSKALATIGGAIGGFRDFATAISQAVSRPAPGSIVEGDQEVTGSKLVPHGIVAGLMNSVADHLDAWVEKAADPDGTTVRLHLFSDYTLFRPVLEGLVEVVWILDGTDAYTRIRRALEVAKIEYTHGVALTSALNKAGTPDEKLSAGILALGRTIRATSTKIGLDPDAFIKARLIDPSTLTKKIAGRVPGSTLQTLSYWALTSAHAHGQLISALRFAVETPLEVPHDGGALFEPDEARVANLVEFVGKLLNIAIGLLNEQGYQLVR